MKKLTIPYSDLVYPYKFERTHFPELSPLHMLWRLKADFGIDVYHNSKKYSITFWGNTFNGTMSKKSIKATKTELIKIKEQKFKAFQQVLPVFIGSIFPNAII